MTKEMGKNSLYDVNNVEEVVDDLTLFDDDLMSRVFDNNIEATELLLRIILDKKIRLSVLWDRMK